jgi:hypothetical protein
LPENNPSRRNLLLLHSVGIALLLAVFIFVQLLPFTIPYKQYFGFILGFLSYALFEYLVNSKQEIILHVFSQKSYWNISFLILYIFLIAIILIPTSSLDQIWFSWSNIPLLNLLKLASIIILCMFFSGYALLKVITYYANQVFSTIELLLLSFLLSFSITSLSAFFCWALYGGTFLNLQFFLVFSNILIALLFIVPIIRQKIADTKDAHKSILVSLDFKFIIFVCLVLFLLLINYAIHSPFPHLLGDEYTHLSQTMQLSNHWANWQSSFSGSIVSYPYWFHLHLLTTIQVSGCSPINCYMLYTPILVLPVFAFYFMVKSIVNNTKSKVPLFAAVIFTTFSGFGWFYAVYNSELPTSVTELFAISSASNSTFDILSGTWLPILIAPYALDLIIFFIILGLIYRPQMNEKLRYSLISIFVALSFLVHVINVVILIILLSILFLFGKKLLPSPIKVNLSVLMGLSLVVLIDFVAPYKTYLWGHLGSALQISLAIMAIFLVINIIKGKVFGGMTIKLPNRKTFVWLPYLLVILYIFSFVLMVYNLPTFEKTLSPDVVPLFLFSLKLGLIVPFALLAIYLGIRKKNHALDVLMIFAFATLLIDFAMRFSLFPFSGLPEPRLFRDIFWPFIAVIGAFGIIKFFQKINFTFSSRKSVKYLFVALTLLLIITTGIPNALLKAEYYSAVQTNSEPSQAQQDALNFIYSLNIPSGKQLLTISTTSKNQISALTGVDVTTINSQFAPLIFQSDGPESVLFMLNYLDIKYIYLSTSDLTALQANQDSFFNWFITHIPVIFKNAEVTIYEVPEVSPPLPRSDFSIVTTGLVASNELGDASKVVIWFDTEFKDGWQQTKQNGNYTFSSTDNTGTLNGKTFSGKASSSFWIKSCSINTTSSTIITFKFKSSTPFSYGIFDLLFTDGTNQRLGGYLSSQAWQTFSYSIDSNKTLKSVRLGVYDDSQGHGADMQVAFDDIEIYEIPFLNEGKINNWYLPEVLIATMRLNYSTCSLSDFYQSGSPTLLMTDLALSDEQKSTRLQWVSGGGTLLVLGSTDQGSFSQFLGIAKTGETIAVSGIKAEGLDLSLPSNIEIDKYQPTSTDVQPLAYYTFSNSIVAPFAFQKNFGSGKIVYLEISSIFKELDQNNSSSTQLFSTLSGLSEFIKSCADITTYSDEKAFYVKNFGQITITGDVSINTTSLIFTHPFLCNTLEMAHQTGLSNVMIRDVEILGQVTASVAVVNGSITIRPSKTGLYSILTINGPSDWSVNCSPNSSIVMSVEDTSGQVMNINSSISQMQLSLAASNVSVVIRNPIVSSNGTSQFSELSSSWPYDFSVSQQWATINGLTNFNVKMTGEGFLLDQFTFIGTLYVPEETGWNEFDIPLSIIFIGVWVILFTTIFFFVITKKRHNVMG